MFRNFFRGAQSHTVAGIGAVPYVGIEFDGDGDGQLEVEDFEPTIGVAAGFGIGKIWHW